LREALRIVHRVEEGLPPELPEGQPLGQIVSLAITKEERPPQYVEIELQREDTPRPVRMLSYSPDDKYAASGRVDHVQMMKDKAAAQAAAAAAPTPPTQYTPPPEQPRKKPAEQSTILFELTGTIERALKGLEDPDIERLTKQADVARPWAHKLLDVNHRLNVFATQLTEALKPKH
jgi:hypothetical protein